MTDTTKHENAKSVLEAVTARIKLDHEGGALLDSVVGAFVTRENLRRSDLLVRGLDAMVDAQKKHAELDKPDGKSYTSAAADAPPNVWFTEKRRQEVAAAKKRLEKIDHALDQAIKHANFEPLEKALKGGGKDDEKEAA